MKPTMILKALANKAMVAFPRTGLRISPPLYHLWYYNTNVWQKIKWMGVLTQKSPMDLWNYQEILYALKPSLILEFGSFSGGASLFFASVMRQIGNPFKIMSVDVDTSRFSEKVLAAPEI